MVAWPENIYPCFGKWGSEGGLDGYLMGIRFLCNRLCGAFSSVAHSFRVRAGTGGRTVDPGGASALVLLLVCSRVLQTRNRESF
jgi:hypothetical protein